MKGNEQLIGKLNDLLKEELTAINQYMVHAEMLENWRYRRLYKSVWARAMTEMKHAEKLIERILFLDGKPVVSQLDKITIGEDAATGLRNDLNLEYDAVRRYNEAVKLAVEVGDNATKEILEAILAQEDEHVDELEAFLDQIKQLGVELFLNSNVTE